MPVQDPEALALAVKKMVMATDDERSLMGLGAYTRIVENFTMKCTEQKFKKIYDRFYSNTDVL